MYQEYPKWVTVGDLEPVLVHGADEEAKLTGKSEAAVEKAAEKNEKAAEADEADRDADVQKELTEKGSAVTEADVVKINDIAQKRGPGRPAKAK